MSLGSLAWLGFDLYRRENESKRAEHGKSFLYASVDSHFHFSFRIYVASGPPNLIIGQFHPAYHAQPIPFNTVPSNSRTLLTLAP